MIKNLFSFCPPFDLRLSAPYLISLAFGLVLIASLFCNPNQDDFADQHADISLSYLDSNYSGLGYLPTSNPFTWVYKNQQSFGDACQSVDWLYRKIWAVFQEIRVNDFSPKNRFDSILAQLHISHFYF